MSIRSKNESPSNKLDEIDQFYKNIDLFYPARQIEFFEELVIYLFSSRISNEDVVEISKLMLFYLYTAHDYKHMSNLFVRIHEIVKKYFTNESTIYLDLLAKLRIKGRTTACLLPHECKLYFCGLERFIMRLYFYFKL